MKFVSGRRQTSRMNLQNQFGSSIKKLREEKGFTQEDLAAIIGPNSHASYVGAVETGKKFPRAETIVKFAEALEVPIYQLFLFERDVSEKERSIMELVDYLKNQPEPESDARFLLSVCREHVKEYSVKKRREQ